MKDSSSRKGFQYVFRQELQNREASSGRDIVVDKVQAQEVKVAVTQKEQVDEVWTTTTEAVRTSDGGSSTATTSMLTGAGSGGEESDHDDMAPATSTSLLSNVGKALES